MDNLGRKKTQSFGAVTSHVKDEPGSIYITPPLEDPPQEDLQEQKRCELHCYRQLL